MEFANNRWIRSLSGVFSRRRTDGSIGRKDKTMIQACTGVQSLQAALTERL